MGILAATFANYTANWSAAPPKNGLQKTPADFMPSLLAPQIAQRRTVRPKKIKHDPERFTASTRDLFASLKAQGRMRPAEETTTNG